MMKILCIYPVDETTEFLRPIYEMLAVTKSFSGVTLDAKEDVIQAVKNCDEDTAIIFLGHGASHCLYGRKKSHLIKEADCRIFDGKKVFLLACRSAEFIERNMTASLKEYVGFGNMPTEWEEIIAERDNNAYAYPDINEDAIRSYQIILTDVVSCALSKTIALGKDFRYLYFLIKLLLNKHIVWLMRETYAPQRALSKLLYETKHEIIFKSSSV